MDQKKHQDFEKVCWTKDPERPFCNKNDCKNDGAERDDWLDGGNHFPVVAEAFKVSIVVHVVAPVCCPHADVCKVSANSHRCMQQSVSQQWEH